jgi:hypothetical protein
LNESHLVEAAGGDNARGALTELNASNPAEATWGDKAGGALAELNTQSDQLNPAEPSVLSGDESSDDDEEAADDDSTETSAEEDSYEPSDDNAGGTYRLLVICFVSFLQYFNPLILICNPTSQWNVPCSPCGTFHEFILWCVRYNFLYGTFYVMCNVPYFPSCWTFNIVNYGWSIFEEFVQPHPQGFQVDSFFAFTIQCCNVWLPALTDRHPISIQGANEEVLNNFSIDQMIAPQKCFQVTDPEDSPKFILCYSEWEENQESILPFFNPEFPSIVAWLHPVGHEVKHILGWSDHVLDGTRVNFSHSTMTLFHAPLPWRKRFIWPGWHHRWTCNNDAQEIFGAGFFVVVVFLLWWLMMVRSNRKRVGGVSHTTILWAWLWQ